MNALYKRVKIKLSWKVSMWLVLEGRVIYIQIHVSSDATHLLKFLCKIICSKKKKKNLWEHIIYMVAHGNFFSCLFRKTWELFIISWCCRISWLLVNTVSPVSEAPQYKSVEKVNVFMCLVKWMDHRFTLFN